MKGYLVLENGSIYEGERIGVERDVICEVVFNTSMTGYLEIFTDPSYAGPQLYKVCLDTPSKEASFSWVKSSFFLSSIIFSPNVIFSPLIYFTSYPFHYK